METKDGTVTTRSASTVLARFSASHPRGSWPAEEYAAQQREQGRQARVVMDLATDKYLVVSDEPKAVTA